MKRGLPRGRTRLPGRWPLATPSRKAGQDGAMQHDRGGVLGAQAGDRWMSLDRQPRSYASQRQVRSGSFSRKVLHGGPRRTTEIHEDRAGMLQHRERTRRVIGLAGIPTRVRLITLTYRHPSWVFVVLRGLPWRGARHLRFAAPLSSKMEIVCQSRPLGERTRGGGVGGATRPTPGSLFGFDTALIHHKGTKHPKINKINILRMAHDLCVLCAFVVEKGGGSALERRDPPRTPISPQSTHSSGQ
jgi:hypothetical protein